MANQFLSLSLFLMLLSFFIVLNSISDFEDNNAVPAVLNSLTLAFSGQEKGAVGDGPSNIISQYQDKREGDTLESLDGLFNEHIAGFKAKRNRLGTVLHVSLPMQRFENAVKDVSFDDLAYAQEDKQSFVTTLVTLLRSSEKGQPYRVDMVMNISEDPAILSENSPDEFIKYIKRVSALAFNLEGKGLPKKMMSSGLARGTTGIIDLYFYRYKAFKMEGNSNENNSVTNKTLPNKEVDL